METKKETSQRWDDVVFENRNKDYGAYSIRRAYSQNVSKAFMMALGAALLFFIIPMIASSFKSIDKKDDPGNELPTIILGGTPPIIEPVKPQHPATPPPPAKKVTGNNFAVTEQPVDDSQIDKIDPNATPVDGPEDGVATNPTQIEGNGKVIVPEPPAIVEPPKPVEPTIYTGINAEYKGGIEAMRRFLGRHLRYPAASRRIGVDGIVYVSFVVDTEGKVVNAKVIKGIDKDCDEEAVRVVSKMTDWIPAQQNNHKVMVRMVLPIRFLLEV